MILGLSRQVQSILSPVPVTYATGGTPPYLFAGSVASF